jgi:hypothetical protein
VNEYMTKKKRDYQKWSGELTSHRISRSGKNNWSENPVDKGCVPGRWSKHSLPCFHCGEHAWSSHPRTQKGHSSQQTGKGSKNLKYDWTGASSSIFSSRAAWPGLKGSPIPERKSRFSRKSSGTGVLSGLGSRKGPLRVRGSGKFSCFFLFFFPSSPTPSSR